MADDIEGGGSEGAERLELDGVVENVEDVGVLAKEDGSAAVEMKALGEAAEEVERDGWRGGVGGENEVLYGDDSEKVLVFLH